MNYIKGIFTNKVILKKIAITLFLILLFRLGALVTIPGVDVVDSSGIDNGSSFLGIMNLLGGGGLTFFSLFALGVTPYITASIIIQLLTSDVIPPLTRLKKQGEKGRVKIERITRVVALLLAIFQAVAITLSLDSSGVIEITGFFDSKALNVFILTVILVAGSMITIWIADLITMRGVGNGTSLIIFTGIIAQVPTKIEGLLDYTILDNPGGKELAIGISTFIMFILLSLLLVFIISFFESSERKIPIQQTGSGLQLDKEKQTVLPIKLNPAGVIPVIFASAIMTLPPTIAQFFSESSKARHWIVTNFELSSAFGISLYSFLILAFSFFYANINFNAEEIADSFQKNSTFILGIKPGVDTKKYIYRVVNTIMVIGAFVLTLIAILPHILELANVPPTLTIGGTSIIIAVSIAYDTWDQIKSRYIAETSKKNSSKKSIDGLNIKEVESTRTLLFD